MPEGFVSLATLLRGEQAVAVAAKPPASRALPNAPRDARVAVADAHPPLGTVEVTGPDTVRELALMRLAALEAFERAAHRLLRLLAGDVLGRELLLAPVEIDALVTCAVSALADAGAVALAVSSADAERVRSPLPMRIDPQLVAGDLVVDVRDGSIESHFAFRLASALERAETAA